MRAGTNFTQGAALPAKHKTSHFPAGMLQLPQHRQVRPRLHPSEKALLAAMQSSTLPPAPFARIRHKGGLALIDFS